MSNNYGGGGAHYGNGGQGCAAAENDDDDENDDDENDDDENDEDWAGGNGVTDTPLAFVDQTPVCPPHRRVAGGVSNVFEQDEPLMSGAGGGCASPQGGNGNGGGVVVIHGQRLCLGTTCAGNAHSAKLLATGKTGANGGGGGGGGGSISIEVDSLEASFESQLSVEGGWGSHSKSGGGGGGGGGRLYVAVPRNKYRNVAEEEHNEQKEGIQAQEQKFEQVQEQVQEQEHEKSSSFRSLTFSNSWDSWDSWDDSVPNSTGGPFVHFHADVSVSGGNGSYLNGSGYDGHISSQSCPFHYELAPLYNAHHDPISDKWIKNKLACQLCAAGYYQQHRGEQCSGCTPGQFQNATGQSSCLPCQNNSYCLDANCSRCNTCDTGNYTNSSTAACQTCPICNDQKSTKQNGISCRPKEHADFCTPVKTSDGSATIQCERDQVLPHMVS